MSGFRVNGASLQADPSGALLWPERRTVVAADLHLEKGSGFASKGTLLPPYDSAATLERLARVIDAHDPERVICLGDSFHDGDAPLRLGDADARAVRALTGRVEWIWIAGNHDPEPPRELGGRAESELVLGPLVFRHQARSAAGALARGGQAEGEVSGHYHPKAWVSTRGRRVGGRCFVEDGTRLILPAFGAYAGGLDVLDPAIRALLGPDFAVHLIGRDRVHRFARAQLA